MTVNKHSLLVADLITYCAAAGAALGWAMGKLPTILSVLVLITALFWNYIQITSSDWWKDRAHRLHVHRMRRKSKRKH
jgi:hypothetical protein